MTSNEKVNRLPEKPTPELANTAYSHIQQLLDYAPASQWRGWLEHVMEIIVADESWTHQDENERAASVAGYFKLIHTLEDLEAKA